MGGRYAIVHGRAGNRPLQKQGPSSRERNKLSGRFGRGPLHSELPCGPLLEPPPGLSPPEGEPVKESGTYVRRDSVAESITTDAVRACSEIADVVAEYDLHRELHEGKIRRLLDLLSARQINNLRYRLFAPHYDGHMENHEAAIRLLMHQILPIERLSSARRPIDLIIQPDILDLSCGTGTIIRILEDILSLRRARELRITANDLSDDMKEIAREKLRGFPGRVEFTGQDLTKLEMGREFGTIFLSQTLHLITDEDVVRQERQANYLHVDSDRHFEAKMGALLRAWGHLRVGGTMACPALGPGRAARGRLRLPFQRQPEGNQLYGFQLRAHEPVARLVAGRAPQGPNRLKARHVCHGIPEKEMGPRKSNGSS
jgi:SAM-dependent methyltransferase